MLPMLENYANVFNCDCVGFEYPGYGLTASDTSPSESGCIDAAEAAFEYVLNVLNVPRHRIILFGQSLGTGPAVDLASRHECGGLLLFSPLLSAIRTHAPSCLACMCRCGDYFTSIYKAERIRCRCLIVHGTEDSVVPFSHGQALHELLQKPHEPVWVQHAGHNDLLEVCASCCVLMCSTPGCHAPGSPD
eukprot:TRINITY_DN6729_c0_g1_i2.p2 TRINITY_DN6729_c0_g1~~TRINITY_DN6729_c0_g1_i2.p2  ORF type:complete len:190 (+),score=48.14 TRINITY_DN6729_c0_g1_i2:253-822(+)